MPGDTVIDPPVAPTVPAVTPGRSDPDPLASSRALKELGVDLNTVDWMARYNGAIGAFGQRLASIAKTSEKLTQEKKLLEENLKQVTARIEELGGKTAKMPELEKALADVTLRATTAESQLEKQRILLEFPSLLTGSATGGTNPFVELAMSSTLPADQLRIQLASVAGTMAQPAAPRLPMTGATPPAPTPALGSGNDAESYHKQAIMWHDKFLDSHGTDFEASSKEAEYWELYKKAQG